MRWWNQWTRKRDGWIERKRGIQKMFTEKEPNAPEEIVPEVANEKVPRVEFDSVTEP